MNMPHPLPVIANRVGGHFLIGHIKMLTTIFTPSSWHSCLSRQGNGQVIAFLYTTQVAASWCHTLPHWWQLAGVTHVPHRWQLAGVTHVPRRWQLAGVTHIPHWWQLAGVTHTYHAGGS